MLAALAVQADAQPPPKPKPPKPAPKVDKAPPPSDPVPASTVKEADIPAHTQTPPRFAVAPFQNQSTSKNLDWLIAGAPFEIDEKSEAVLGLAPTGGPLVVGTSFDSEDPGLIAAYAKERRAAYVVTGWVNMRQENLRIAITIWKVGGPTGAIVVGEAKQTTTMASYHQALGQLMAKAWSAAGVPIDKAHAELLERPLSATLYPVTLMGRGLGYLTGAIEGKPDLKKAEHDFERAVFIDPKMSEGQRLAGEVYLAEGDVRKAAAKFNYAQDLAPDDLNALRAAATAAKAASKHDLALELFKKIVVREPWDIEARYELGAAMWATGDGNAAEKQLEQVTAVLPDFLPARHQLVLIHASRNDTKALVAELEAIAVRAPADLEVKADLASAYGALGRWADSTVQLEQIAAARAPDLGLLVRIADGHLKSGDLAGAMSWYGKAQAKAPESSLPMFATAEALFDAGKLADAAKWFTLAQKYKYDVGSAEEALGAIAMLQGRTDDAAWYLRRAAREVPRSRITRRALVAAELGRKDAKTALEQVEPALAAWPDDGQLHYLAGVAHAMDGDREGARGELVTAISLAPSYLPARTALSQLDAGGVVPVAFVPQLERPWGDAEAVQASVDHYAATATKMAAVRAAYQASVLGMLGELGAGPLAKKAPKTCPLGEIAPTWAAAQGQLEQYYALGVDLEADYRFVMRHEEAGAAQGLLPNGRQAVAAMKKSFRLALSDVSELRGEWGRGLVPELRAVGCSDKLLAAAVKDPEHYKVITEDVPEALPAQTPPRPKPRATFYVDNTRCSDAVDVWIEGQLLGSVAPGRRSALVADGGEKTLCLVREGGAQCGDRGTVRQVYLHDGWSVTIHCLK